MGWNVTSSTETADAIVIASMGRGDEEALEAALASGAGYVGLVASAKRRGSAAELASAASTRSPSRECAVRRASISGLLPRRRSPS